MNKEDIELTVKAYREALENEGFKDSLISYFASLLSKSLIELSTLDSFTNTSITVKIY